MSARLPLSSATAPSTAVGVVVIGSHHLSTLSTKNQQCPTDRVGQSVCVGFYLEGKEGERSIQQGGCGAERGVVRTNRDGSIVETARQTYYHKCSRMVVVLRREWLSHGHDATSRSEFIAKPLEKKTMVADARAVLLY